MLADPLLLLGFETRVAGRLRLVGTALDEPHRGEDVVPPPPDLTPVRSLSLVGIPGCEDAAHHTPVRLPIPRGDASGCEGREAITELCERLEIEDDVVERIRIAVTEACTNCVQHAFAGNHRNPTYMLEAGVEDGALVVVIHDYGFGIVRGQRSTNAGLGLGLRLIDKLADSAEVASRVGHGTRVEMGFAAHHSSGLT